MISASSEELSKPDQRDGDKSPVLSMSQLGQSVGTVRLFGSKKRWIVAALLLFIVFVFIAGPSILLNLLLKNMFPAESGLSLNYDRARAGFLFNSASVEKVQLKSISPEIPLPTLTIESILLDGVSLKGFLALSSAPEKMTADPVFLARSVSVKNAALNNEFVQAELAEVRMRNLILALKEPASNLPARFDLMEARNLKYSVNHLLFKQNVELSQVEARNLSSDNLGALKLTLLAFEEENKEQPEKNISLSLDGLTAGGLKLAALRQAVKGHGGSVPWWWFLAGCDTLDLARAELRLNRKEAINVESAVFDFNPIGENTVDYTRRIDFKVNTANLAEFSRNQLWHNLNDIGGGGFLGRLDFQLNYGSPRGLSILKSACLDLKELGRIEFSGHLYGMPAAKPHYSPFQILFEAYTAWRLEEMTLSFEDRGIAKNFYRFLNRTALADAPGGSIESKIMNYVINPINYELQRERGLANLPAIYNEVEAFVRQPSRLRLSSAPESPYTILSLANIDKYDIIEKLRLTIEVGQRAPVFVAVGSEPEPELSPPAPLTQDQGLDLPFGTE